MKHWPRQALLGLICAALMACADNNAPDLSQATELAVPGAYFLADEPLCPPPQCFEVRIPVADDMQVSDDRVRVVLPKGYADQQKTWPVLYLLHDAPGDYRTWTETGAVFELIKDLPLIAIMPDGGGGNPGWYSDWEDGSFQWQSYHMGVMLPFLEAHLKVGTEPLRAIAGPSMGGYGAMYYSASYPGRFVAAAGFSGAVDFLHLDRVSALYAFLAGFSGVAPSNAIWGDPLSNYPRWQAQDPGTQVEGLRGMRILLSSGNGLPGGPYDNLPAGLPEYGIEPILLTMNQSFADTLAAAGIEHDTWFYGPGYHNWPYYRDAFIWALPQLLQALGVVG
nr:hypothetical protein [Oceanococcus sp. HetDA_MAG_MS8]